MISGCGGDNSVTVLKVLFKEFKKNSLCSSVALDLVCINCKVFFCFLFSIFIFISFCSCMTVESYHCTFLFSCSGMAPGEIPTI